MDHQNAKTQYNGLILLSSYLHRLYVQQSIAVRLYDTDNLAKADKYKQMIDVLNEMIVNFEQTKSLDSLKSHKVNKIFTEVSNEFPSFFKVEPCTLSEKVGIVAASFYGERQLNLKIIDLSNIFNTKIASDYEKRIKFYDERIKLMDFVVLALSKGEGLKPELEQQIEAWYKNVTSIKGHIIDDLQKVELLLMGNIKS